MGTKKLTAAEIAAYVELARAARKLRTAQRRGDAIRQRNASASRKRRGGPDHAR